MRIGGIFLFRSWLGLFCFLNAFGCISYFRWGHRHTGGKRGGRQDDLEIILLFSFFRNNPSNGEANKKHGEDYWEQNIRNRCNP